MSYLRYINKLWHSASASSGPVEYPTPVPYDAKAVNPYRGLPKHNFWSRSHRNKQRAEIDPVISGGFKLKRGDKIATAGSCFAQHIARYLQDRGYNYLVTEKVHPIISEAVARDFGYGVFTARYGNIYTARQLLQLTQRAYGDFLPQEDMWEVPGGYIDPFRPNILPAPFASLDEFYRQRDIHFAAVRTMLETADVFVFTFGLTEAWLHKGDGAVFPLAPGVAGGGFDPERHVFHNFSVGEVVADFEHFVARMRAVNPQVKILMTVSPVPLAATARQDQSVITATSYSKAVLRVAVEELSSKIRDCFYFPSYEVITGNHAGGSYFGADLREVRREGVDHVMGLFMRHYTTHGADMSAEGGETLSCATETDAVEAALEVICEEALIEQNLEPSDHHQTPLSKVAL